MVTVTAKIETILYGNKRHVLCFLAHFATNVLAILSRGSYDACIKFIHGHKPNFWIAYSDLSQDLFVSSLLHMKNKIHVQCKLYGLLQ